MNYFKNIKSASIIAGLTVLSSCNNLPKITIEHSNNTYEINIQKNDERNNNFSNLEISDLTKFKDDNILIACENIDEYRGVLSTFKNRDDLRQDDLKLSFIDRDNYTKIVMPNYNNGVKKNSYIHVINKEDISRVLDQMYEKNISYNIVQLRGHDRDMLGLFQLTKDCSSKNSLYFFGGCDSDYLARELETENRATIGGGGSQESARNTYYLMRIIDLIGSPNVKTWEDLESKLIDSDKRFNHYVSNF